MQAIVINIKTKKFKDFFFFPLKYHYFSQRSTTLVLLQYTAYI